MELAKVQKALEKLATSPWGDKYSVVLDGRPAEAGNADFYIRHSIVFGLPELIGLGGDCARYMCIQYMSIFFQDGVGIASKMQIADEICTYYNMKTVTSTDNSHPPLMFSAPGVIQLPKDQKGFRQIQVNCPFYFDTRS